MKSEVNKYFNTPADKVDVIFNGVDAQKFEFDWTPADRATWRTKFALPDEKIVMYVGRFVREKGIHVLLNAASAVLAQEPDTKFVIVGGGHREHFEKFVRWYGLEQKVLFTGFMANRSLHQVYRVADVAVFPSLYEPFGIVALEGMAAGAAVVASDAGGLREVVVHDETGTTAYAGSAESLAWAVLRVLREPKSAEKMKEAARERLYTEFSWKGIAEQTKAVYERVWSEFMTSYWRDNTLWPVSPGAKERAEKLGVVQKAVTGAFHSRPTRPTYVPVPDAKVGVDKVIEDELVVDLTHD
jgi:glycosyltransferase involved in cell wall biosynthesis